MTLCIYTTASKLIKFSPFVWERSYMLQPELNGVVLCSGLLYSSALLAIATGFLYFSFSFFRLLHLLLLLRFLSSHPYFMPYFSRFTFTFSRFPCALSIHWKVFRRQILYLKFLLNICVCWFFPLFFSFRRRRRRLHGAFRYNVYVRMRFYLFLVLEQLHFFWMFLFFYYHHHLL